MGILGPLEVRVGGVVARVPSRQQRVVLAKLALCANRVVSRDSLIDAVWGERPPATAEQALQVRVSQLRKLIEPGGLAADARVLVTRAPGYLLQVGEEQLDCRRFERLVEEGTAALAADAPGDAARKLREGLALWRGVPLGDLADEEFAQPEVRRLEELRLAALEARIDADLTIATPGLVGELEALTQEHPLRERLRHQLMLCLYRSGRQAEALEVYQEARTALVEELGIEPGRRLRELHQAILRQDPELDLAGAGPEPTPMRRGREPVEHVAVSLPAPLDAGAYGRFVGREADLAWLLERWDQTCQGQRHMVLVGGEPGIGKTRLAGELAQVLQKRAATVLYGRSDPEGLIPYQPFVEALEHYVAEAPLEQLRLALGSSGGELLRLVPAVGHRLPDLPAPLAGEAEGQRYRLFEAVATLLSEASRIDPVLLVLDDLQWADSPTLLLLKHLVRAPGAPLMILGTYRESELERTHPLLQALPVLRREGCERLSLSGLENEEVAQLIAVVSGLEAPPELTRVVWAESEGNPLFVEEVVRHLTELGAVERGADWMAPASLEELGVPEGLMDMIRQRLARLSEGTNRVLAIASVIGRAFDVKVLEALGVAPGDSLLETLEEAIRARVIAEEPSAVGRYAFSHALVREAVYQELTRTRRVSLHHNIGLALEDLHEDQPGRLAELAYHFSRAAPVGDVDKAVTYARRAGERALALLAFEEAARLHGMALTALDLTGDTDQSVRCELLLALGDAQARAGNGPEAKQSFLDAARIAAEGDMSDALARAALDYGGRFVWARAAGDQKLVPLLEQALAALSDADSEPRARLLARLAGALRDEPLRERRARLSREAIGIARRLGDPATLAYTLDGGYAADWGPENHAERLVTVSKFVRVADQAGAQERALEGHNYWAFALMEVGDMPGVRRELDTVIALAEKLRQPAQLWYAATIQGMLALLEGRFDSAGSFMDRALELGRRAQWWEAALYHGLQAYALAAARGRLEEVEPVIRRLVDDYPSYHVCRCSLASLYSRLGREADARAVFESFALADFTELAFDEEWLFGMSLLAETCSFLGDEPRAEQLYALLSPYADRVAVSVPEVCTGSVARYLGMLAVTTRRFDAAVGHFDDARARNEAMGARPWLAHTEHDCARALIARGEPGDGGRARDLLARCIAAYEELGMDAWAREASALRAR